MIQFLKNLFANKNSEALQKAIQKGAFLVDVRSPQEFAAGNVKGSVNIPLDKINSQLQAFKNKETIVVFCRSGMRSTQAKSILNSNGFTNVINGGTWQKINELVNK